MNRRAARQWATVHESREDLPEFPVLPEADRLGSQDEIRRCIADLAPDQAEAVLLHHEWGFSFEEIAGMLGISAGGRRPAIGMSIAGAVTAALPALTANLALEIAPVRVNLIAAGFVDTPLSAELLGDQLEKRRNQLRITLPIGRVVGPADVAALAVNIMTNTALTGATYDIDGGQQFVGA
jgi:hypothetical protein